MNSFKIIEKFEKQWNYLSQQFSFIKKSYYLKDDLEEQIALLQSEIKKGYEILEEENQLIERRRQVMENRLSLVKNREYMHVQYLKEIKNPEWDIPINQSQIIEQKIESQFSNSKTTKIFPNRKLTFTFKLKQIKPILSNNYNHEVPSFPQLFSVHLHHLHHHQSTSFHFPSTSFEYNLKNTNHKNKNMRQNLDRSQKALTIQYTFRHHNVDLYTQLFNSTQFQSIIFSITNSQDFSNVVIAMAKFNINQILSSNVHRNIAKNDDQLIDHLSHQTLFFHKLISFNQSCSIQELPLMCKIGIELNVKQQLISVPLQDLTNFINPRNEKTPSPNKNSRKMSKSPKKMIQKTPQKFNNQNMNLGRSPHHKRQYIKNLLQQGASQNQQKSSKRPYQYSSPLKKDQVKQERQINLKKRMKLTVFQNLQFQLTLRQNQIKLKNHESYQFLGQYFHLIQNQLTSDDIDIGETQNIDFSKCVFKPIVNFIDNSEPQYFNQGQQSFENSYLQHKKPFTLKVLIKISLTSKKKQGKIILILPFVQKLNKFVLSDTGKSIKVPSVYEVIVKQNNLFQIQNFEDIKFDERTLNKSKKIISEGQDSNQTNLKKIENQTIRNKIIRLENNLYMISQGINATKIGKNLNIVNVGYGSISKYIFKKSIKSGQQDQNIDFHFFPCGTVFQVGKNAGGDYVILFKVDHQMYRYYMNLSKNKEKLEEDRKQDDNKFNKNKRLMSENMLIQMAISCRFSLKDKQNQSTQWCTQLQYFTAKLSFSQLQINSYRQITVNQQNEFYQLEMKNIIKLNDTVNITTNESNFLSIVNGRNFKLTTQNSILIIQLLVQIKQSQSLKILLIIDNWQKAQTSFLQLTLLNPLKQPDISINQSLANKQSFNQSLKSSQQKKFISMGKNIKKQQ